MEIPTITRVSLEPFCPACGGGLEIQEDVRTAHDAETDEFLGFAVLCPWCGKMLLTLGVAWRERENDG